MNRWPAIHIKNMIYGLRQPAGSRRLYRIFICTLQIVQSWTVHGGHPFHRYAHLYFTNIYKWYTYKWYLYTGSCRQDQSKLLSMHSVFKVLNRRIYKLITWLFPILINIYRSLISLCHLIFSHILTVCLDSLHAILCKNYVEMDYENDRWVFTVAFCDNEKSFRRTPPGWRLFSVLLVTPQRHMRENIQLQLLLWKSCKEKKAFLLPWIINDVRENWRNYWN